MLEPKIFPTAKPSSFLINAIKDVISSGTEVPNATALMLIAILFSKLNLFDIPIILLIKYSEPIARNKKPSINLTICDKCKLVQLRHNYSLKYLYGPDYGYRTGINLTMRKHVHKITKILEKKAKLKGEWRLIRQPDIASGKFWLDLNKFDRNWLIVKDSTISF